LGKVELRRNTVAHVFTVKSNANRALKAFAAKHPGLAEALSVSAVGAGFVVKVGPFDSADDELRTLAADAGLELVEFAAEGEELPADERLARADEVIAHADATIAANAELLAEVALIASPEELDLPDSFRLGREAVVKALAPAAEPEVFPTRGKAQAAAFERGLGAFTIRKAEGGYVIDENTSPEGFRRAPAPRKPHAAKTAEARRPRRPPPAWASSPPSARPPSAANCRRRRISRLTCTSATAAGCRNWSRWPRRATWPGSRPSRSSPTAPARRRWTATATFA
jgi:hypothetical protein